MAPEPDLDPRFVRFQQGLVALVLLAGFVFSTEWVIPVLAVVLGLGAAFGRSGNVFFFIFDTLVAPRLPEPAVLEDATATRFATLLAVCLLSLATVALAVGLGGLAWILAMALAVMEAVGAVAGIPLGRTIYERFRSRGR